MDTQQVATGIRMSQWMQVIKERQGSGQTIKEFCEEKGIKEYACIY